MTSEELLLHERGILRDMLTNSLFRVASAVAPMLSAEEQTRPGAAMIILRKNEPTEIEIHAAHGFMAEAADALFAAWERELMRQSALPIGISSSKVEHQLKRLHEALDAFLVDAASALKLLNDPRLDQEEILRYLAQTEARSLKVDAIAHER